MNTKFSEIDLEAVICAGDQQLQAEHAKLEAEKAGNLRGGDSGCMVNGEVYGCHRQSIARALGLEIPPDANSLLFFAAGYGMEDQIAAKLIAGWQGEVLQEEDVPVQWSVPSGRQVTGRPDFMLRTHKSGVGIELKTIVSTNSAKQVGLLHKPQTKHLCQAAHYSWQHNTPWILTYVSPARYNCTNNKIKGTGQFEYPGQYYLKIDPFRAHFYLRFDDEGTLVYRHPKYAKEISTVITQQGIQDYYHLIDECLEKKTLYFPPINRYADGSKMPYEHVKYCEACTAAEQAQGDWQHWLDELSLKIEERSNK